MKQEITKFNKLPYKYFSTIFQDEILIYRLEQKLIAVSGFCPHFGGPLEVSDETINCYWHDWSFDIRSHVCSNKKVNIKLREYKIEEISPNEALIEYVN